MTETKSRMCVACREYHNGRGMLRVIKDSEGLVKLDRKGNQNGRGAYVCNNDKCIEKAIKIGAFSRSLHVKVPQEVITDLREELKTIEE